MVSYPGRKEGRARGKMVALSDSVGIGKIPIMMTGLSLLFLISTF